VPDWPEIGRKGKKHLIQRKGKLGKEERKGAIFLGIKGGFIVQFIFLKIETAAWCCGEEGPPPGGQGGKGGGGRWSNRCSGEERKRGNNLVGRNCNVDWFLSKVFRRDFGDEGKKKPMIATQGAGKRGGSVLNGH